MNVIGRGELSGIRVKDSAQFQKETFGAAQKNFVKLCGDRKWSSFQN